MQGVSVSRGGRDILGPLDFKIQNGERWVILGPNGAGKSTLLNILATRIFPTRGTVKILDKEMGKVDLSELRTRIGICASLLAEDIPDDEFVRDVVLTAAYAIVGRWNETYDLWDESSCSINIYKYQLLIELYGGGSGIRTHGTTLHRTTP